MFASTAFVALGLLLASTSTVAVPSPASIVARDTGSSFNPVNYNKPDAGPPLAWFRGDTNLPIAKLAAAAKTGTKSIKTYPISQGSSTRSTIYGDWLNLNGVSAYYFTADMDVDCDGIDFNCEGNPDGQSETNWGALASYEVPWIVIPQSFVDSNGLQGNEIVAVICNGKLIYGVFGDSNGDSPEVIGEGSWVLAKKCFPTETINGNAGHGTANVAYIVFKGQRLPSSAINENYITNFDTLRTTGDRLVGQLVAQLGL